MPNARLSGRLNQLFRAVDDINATVLLVRLFVVAKRARTFLTKAHAFHAISGHTKEQFESDGV